jgi:hypothetical protein
MLDAQKASAIGNAITVGTKLFVTNLGGGAVTVVPLGSISV